MLTARPGRSFFLALVVHFALLLPVADLAHHSGHADEETCEVCLTFATLQTGAVPAQAAMPPPAPYLALPPPVHAGPGYAMPGRATARGPPLA